MHSAQYRLYLYTIYTRFDIVGMVPLDSGKSSVLWTKSISGPGALAPGGATVPHPQELWTETEERQEIKQTVLLG